MFTGYLPPRFLMSEVLETKSLPIWNPYIAFGIPFYGDMSGTYWNPITWLIAGTSGYNAYTLTAEVMFYLVSGAIGMYFLSGQFSQAKYIRYLAAIAYLCNGYTVGHLQHLNWLSGLAILPWCLWSLHRMFQKSDLSRLLQCALIFYLFLSSTHPGIIIGAFYFFIPYLFFLFLRPPPELQLIQRTQLIKPGILFLVLLLLLSAGLIFSYAEIISVFSRKEKLQLVLLLNENTTIKSWLSFFLPFSTIKNKGFFENDIAFRNCYIGLLFLALLFWGIWKKMASFQWLLISLAAFFLLLSIGGQFKVIANKCLPFIGYVRVNAEFRIFALLSLILFAVQQLQKLTHYKETDWKRLLVILKSFLLIFSVFLFIGIFLKWNNYEEHTASLLNAFPTSIRSQLKAFIDHLSFSDTIIFQSILQILIVTGLLIAVKQKKIKTILFISSIDLILATLLNLPFTGVGRIPVHAVQEILNMSPQGTPKPAMNAINHPITLNKEQETLIGNWDFYNKQPGNRNDIHYPVKLTSVTHYYEIAKKDHKYMIEDNPFLFVTDRIITYPLQLRKKITTENIIEFKTDNIHLRFTADSAGNLIILQNYYKYWRISINGKASIPGKLETGFMYVPISTGENNITISFKHSYINWLLPITAIILLIYFLLIFIPFKKKLK